jgi:hypothetical protein
VGPRLVRRVHHEHRPNVRSKMFEASTVKLLVESLDIIVFRWAQMVACTCSLPSVLVAEEPQFESGQPCKGVDLNRNYDFLWSSGIGPARRRAAMFSRALLPSLNQKRAMSAVCSGVIPTSLHDNAPFSELVLYPWGDDENQAPMPR